MNDWDKKPLLRPSEEGQSPIQVRILGDFVLSSANGRQFPIATKKNRALLAILALSPGFQATRERLCGLLWGDRGEDQARSSLRQSLAVLRKELGQIEELVLKTHDDIVALRSDTAQIDAVEFLALSNDSGITTLRQAARLYRGELLSDTSIRDAAFEDWLSAERSRLRTVAIKIFDRLIPLEDGHSRIVAAQQLVSFDPLRESSHRLLMQAYADQGDNGLALKQFELCRKLLHEELSVEPAAETQALRTAIAKGTLSKVEAAAGASKGEGFDRNPAVPADKPSIAVLPFANLTGDPHQDFLCDGISQNITDDLARFHDLVVIASDSAFVYRNRNASIQAMSQDLGARYLLQGSVETSGNHLRIQARLVDGKSGQQVWSESYDGHPDSIFSLQDSVTKTIASTLATAYGGRLLKAWERRPDRAATRNMLAIDLFQRGMQSLNRFTKEDNVAARRLFQEAAQHDPNYAKPLAKAAWTHIVDCYFGWSSNPQTSLQASLELARKAVSTDPDEPWAYWALSGYYQHEGDFERAIAGYEKALELNPNDADVVTDYGWCLSFAGRAEEGLAMAQKAMRLNPHHPDWYIFQFAQLQFNAKKYRDAVNTTKRLREVDTASAQLYLAASYAALGEVKNASMAVTRALELDPQASIERYTSRDMAQYQVAADLDRFRDFLRKAGLQETSNSSLARMDENPSIAVLPFDNMSGDPEQDYFAEGIAEDITTELSRFRQFKIQARTAAALFHGSEAEALNAGRELGVRYFVTGSVRRLGQRLRISTQLVDARTGSQVWAEHFDRSEEDLFTVQDEVIRTIVSTLAGRAEAAGAEQTKRRHPGSLGAYECVLRAETLPLYDRKSQIEARALYEKAIDLDPVYARPHAMLANLDVIDWMEDMSGSDAILDRALELAKKSVLLDDNDATCQMTLGAIYSNLRSFQLAGHHYQRAMDLNRNNPLVVATVGTLRLYRGDAVNAVKVFEEARILDPFFEPSWYWPTLGIARFALGQYLEAIALLERSPNRPHWVTAYLAASFALIGEEHRASQAAAETQRTLPSFLLERFTAKEWPPESDTGKKLLDGLRKAGLPERSNYGLARMDKKPTIAVLPFINLSGDPQHDYFADGITEDITTELSRFKGLFVVARNSAFSFKTKSVAAAAIAKELGVRFLLEGSVRRSGDRIRVTARLVDAEAGGEAWAERYDRVIEDIFVVQDDVVRTIVATLEGQLASTVASQSRRQTPSSILAYECVLQARKFLDVYDAHSAEPLLRRAIAADGRYAQAHAWMAMVYWVKFFNDHQEKDITEAVVFGKTAVALDPGDSVCHMQLGFAYIFARKLELADIHSLKALELNPADMLALGLRAQLLCRLGRSQEAIEALDQLVRHDPFPPNWYWENRSIVLLTLDKFEEALAAIQHMQELFWWNHCYVAVCCARLGRIEEAQDAAKRALKLRPGLTIQRFMMGEPFKLHEDANRMIEGLRMAGLAEHADISSAKKTH